MYLLLFLFPVFSKGVDDINCRSTPQYCFLYVGKELAQATMTQKMKEAKLAKHQSYGRMYKNMICNEVCKKKLSILKTL